MATTQRIRGAGLLTDTSIRAWLRKEGPAALHDGAGLYLRRRGEGAYWSLRQINRTTGKRTWAALFPDVPYPTASLADARCKALEARLVDANTHQDLVRTRQAEIADIKAKAEEQALAASRRVTVRALYVRWAATELAPRVGADGKRTGRKDGGAYTLAQFERRVFPALGDRAVGAVSKADLLTVIDRAKVEGKLRTANVLLGDLKQMFRFALVRDLIDRNPLDTVTKRDAGGPETERDRILSADEIATLARAVPEAQMGPRSALAIWLILATACRVSEAMGARWEHVDLVGRTWYLPETKNERDHTIHLSAFAVRQFEALYVLRESRDGVPLPWVFPNSIGRVNKKRPGQAPSTKGRVAGPVNVATFGKQLADRQRDPARRLKKRSAATQSLTLAGGRWTAHDLRRTAASLMAGAGISEDVIEECLNHKLRSKVARIYIRDRRLTQQAAAFDALGARLARLVDGATGSNVVPFPVAA